MTIADEGERNRRRMVNENKGRVTHLRNWLHMEVCKTMTIRGEMVLDEENDLQ